jgi:hypothetical protein
MKVLVIGFPRSGTSLMYRVVKLHPEVKKMFFETNMLKRVGTDSENVLNNFFPKKINVGEKVIYEKDVMGKKPNTSPTPVDYCKIWNKRFKREAKIIQIIRHPYDVWNSLIIHKYMKRNIKYSVPRMLENYFKFIPTYFDTISKFKNCFTVKYEDMILNSDILIPQIYEHCGLSTNYRFKERMKARRVFLYKTNGFKIHDVRLHKQKNEFMEIFDNNIDECLKVLNQFPGPEYEK